MVGRREGEEKGRCLLKGPTFPSFWGSSPLLFAVSSSTAKERKVWSSGMVPFGLQQSGREEPCGGWEGDIDDTRMEPMQPKRAGFSLMDCLPSLLPWGQ